VLIEKISYRNHESFEEYLGIFSMLSDSEKMILQKNILKLSVKKGEIIYAQNEEGQFIYYLIDGKIKLSKYISKSRRIITNIISSSNFFGMKSILNGTINNEDAEALSNAAYYQIPSSTIRLLSQKNAVFSEMVFYHLFNYINKAESQLSMFHSSKNVRDRVVKFIIDFTNEFGRKVGVEMVVELFLTHEEIADFVLTSRQSITQIMNDLQNEELICYDRDKILIRDIDKLLKIN
jgi:CRP/FNR family transcriptional regulator, cyclic AMP receptor protein